MIVEGNIVFDKIPSVYDAVWSSLRIRKGSFFQNPDFGSELHLLAQAKDTDESLLRAKSYVLDAVKWLVESGKITVTESLVKRYGPGKYLLEFRFESKGERFELPLEIKIGGQQ